MLTFPKVMVSVGVERILRAGSSITVMGDQCLAGNIDGKKQREEVDGMRIKG